MNSVWGRWLAIAASLILCLFTGGGVLRAQGLGQFSSDGGNRPRSPADLFQNVWGLNWWFGTKVVPEPSATFHVVPDPVETQEPYLRWHHHTGTASECIASLRIRQSGVKDQFVSALVIRCDGFILVPRTAYEKVLGGVAGDVIITGAESESITKALPIAGWDKFASRNSRVDYALLKVNDHHIRCLPLLSGGNARAGDSVRVVYSVPKVEVSSATCSAVTLHTVVGTSSDQGLHFTLQFLRTESGQAVSAETVPLGATVVDDDTGAALGMVTTVGNTPSFSSFLRFNDEFTEVGLTPSRDALRAMRTTQKIPHTAENAAAGVPDGQSISGMVVVPGGPVTLSGAVQDHYLKAFGTDVACMPDFHVDEVPTTNAQYSAWLASNRGATPLPIGWQPGEVENPIRLSDFPVTGVSAKEAVAYLRSRGKRLLTEVEWQRASKVSDLNWLELVWREWEDLDADFSEWWLLERLYSYCLAWEIYVRIAGFDQQHLIDNSEIGFHETPQQAWAEVQAMSRAVSLRIDLHAKKAFFPRYIHPVGVYPGDMSVYGVRDVVLNAPEMMIPLGFRESTGWKPFADTIDPYTSSVTCTRRRDPATDDQTLDQSPIIEQYLYSELAGADTPPSFFRSHFWRYPTGAEKLWHLTFSKSGEVGTNRDRSVGAYYDYRPMFNVVWSIEWHNTVMPEFRGAR